VVSFTLRVHAVQNEVDIHRQIWTNHVDGITDERIPKQNRKGNTV
jgi:hypothetical protein